MLLLILGLILGAHIRLDVRELLGAIPAVARAIPSDFLIWEARIPEVHALVPPRFGES